MSTLKVRRERPGGGNHTAVSEPEEGTHTPRRVWEVKLEGVGGWHSGVIQHPSRVQGRGGGQRTGHTCYRARGPTGGHARVVTAHKSRPTSWRPCAGNVGKEWSKEMEVRALSEAQTESLAIGWMWEEDRDQCCTWVPGSQVFLPGALTPPSQRADT